MPPCIVKLTKCLLALGLFSFSASASASSSQTSYATHNIHARETFDESLTLRSLRDGRVSAAFEFKTVLRGARPRDPGTLPRKGEEGEGDVPQHYTLFPLELGQILRSYAVTELHLGLRAGKWNYDAWGAPGAWVGSSSGSPDVPSGGEAGAATGAELYAWMGDVGSGDGGISIDDRWAGLRSALAGLFCASLESLDERRTCSPIDAFPPAGALPPLSPSSRRSAALSNSTRAPGWGGGQYELRHALQPAEHVCTENLTPFVRLLPCKAAAGLGQLLNPQRLFDADWHGLGVHVRWIPPSSAGGDGEGGVELVLAAQAVFDPVRLSGTLRSRDWSFQRLFDHAVEARCPVARSSRVYVELPQETAYSIVPEPTEVKGSVATYDLTEDAERIDISLRYLLEKHFQHPTERLPSLSPLTVRRALLGTSQAHGALAVSVTNNLDTPIRVGYLETLPALVTLWLHTLTVTLDGDSQPRNDLLTDLAYQPSLPHGAHKGPSVLQATLSIPPHATLRIAADIGKAFLRYTEHQPDAMRGWDLPGAVFFPANEKPNAGANTNETAPTIGHRIHTPNLLVDLATPDFSMPYNVIILSCTLLTLIFGSVFNLLTRRWVLVDMDEGQDAAAPGPESKRDQ